MSRIRDHPDKTRRRCLQILGLSEGATTDEIRKSYKAGALKYHPDKNKDASAKGKFQEVLTAYKYLTEGTGYLQTELDDNSEDDAFVYFLRKMFPWMFEFGGFFNNGNARSSSTRNAGPQYSQPPPRASQRQSFWTEYSRKNRAEARQKYSSYYTDSDARSSARHDDYSPGTSASKRKNKKKKPFSPQNESTASGGTQSKSPSPEMKTSNGCRENKDPPIPTASKAGSKGEETGASNSQQANSQQTNSQQENSQQAPKKKTKKQILQEQRKREKEIAQIAEQLKQMEKEQQEKTERKRIAQAEKDRKERERKEQILEEERNIEEKRRQEAALQKQLEEEAKKMKQEQEARMKKLMEDFDNIEFLDESGDFRTTQPEISKIILDEELNFLGDTKRPADGPEHLTASFSQESVEHDEKTSREHIQEVAQHVAPADVSFNAKSKGENLRQQLRQPSYEWQQRNNQKPLFRPQFQQPNQFARQQQQMPLYNPRVPPPTLFPAPGNRYAIPGSTLRHTSPIFTTVFTRSAGSRYGVQQNPPVINVNGHPTFPVQQPACFPQPNVPKTLFFLS